MNNKYIVVLSILIGTILEWYDFSLLASMATIISVIFFPSKNAALSLMATFGVFASGFLMRPIGGALFGHIGDRYGRKEALSLTIILMAVPTTLIGLLPTFHAIGIVAPIILVFLRLIQGAASSGEYPGAICFLTEIAPVDKRGLWGSASMIGVVGGVFLGTLVNFLLSSNLSEQQLYSWGWRIPFLTGLPLGALGWLMRYKISETAVYKAAKATQKTLLFPLSHVFRFSYSNLIKIIILFSASTVIFYSNFVYVMTYLVRTHEISFRQSLLDNMLGVTALIIFIPFFGYLSDKLNRKLIILIGALCLSLFSYPIFVLLLNQNLWGQILSALFLAIFVGPLAATAAEVFSTCMRYSGISISLNVGASIFGGTSPLIATYLVYYSGHETMPAIYAATLGVICFFTILSMKSNLPDDILKNKIPTSLEV